MEKSFKGKTLTPDGRQTDWRTDVAPSHKLSWPSARWANIIYVSIKNKLHKTKP